MSYNKATASDDYVTLEATANAWTIDIRVTPKPGVTIGISSYAYMAVESHGDSRTYDGEEGVLYTVAKPFYGQLGDNHSTLGETTEYDITISYDLYRNGSVLEYNRLLGVRVCTVSREESGSGSGNLGILPIEYASCFTYESGKVCKVVFCVNFYHFHAGEDFSIKAEVNGQKCCLTLYGDDMAYTERTVTVDGETYPVRDYSFEVSAAQIGYGRFTVNLTTNYNYPCYAACESLLYFCFTGLEEGAKFKLLAEDWNALGELLRKAAIYRGYAVSEIPTVHENEEFTLMHVSDMRQLFLTLYDNGNGIDFGSGFDDIHVFSHMTYGKRPDGAWSAYELLSRFQFWANIVLSALNS